MPALRLACQQTVGGSKHARTTAERIKAVGAANNTWMPRGQRTGGCAAATATGKIAPRCVSGAIKMRFPAGDVQLCAPWPLAKPHHVFLGTSSAHCICLPQQPSMRLISRLQRNWSTDTNQLLCG